MKKIFLSSLEVILRFFTKIILNRFKPRVIAVTGSVGKTSTKSAIYAVFKKAGDKRVKMSGGNLNSELGLPLAILGNYETTGGIIFWIRVLLGALWKTLFFWSKKKYPEILVLEYGADKPKDIEKLVSLIRPDISVVTAVGDVPVHVEFYESADAVAKEKSILISGLRPGGRAVLNIDDPRVYKMRELAAADVITYGFDGMADIRISDFKNYSKNGKPHGILLTLSVNKNKTTFDVQGVFGKSQAYALAAAVACAVSEGISLRAAIDSLRFYEGVKGRTKLIQGIKKSFILDDSYNASPLSSSTALEILDELEAERKIAILGDMLELGIHTEKAHIDLGRHAAKIADYIVTVGARASFIADGALGRGFPEKQIKRFSTSDEAKLPVQEMIREGDLILIKGSQGMRLEKIVLEIMAEPQRAKELLVRQYGKWLKN